MIKYKFIVSSHLSFVCFISGKKSNVYGFYYFYTCIISFSKKEKE